MTITTDSFGSRLKAEREGRGITLRSIAASTKIKESLLADLERDDVAKWPQGIFRRAFIRAYAASIGLSPDRVVAEFQRLFPEDPATAPLVTHAPCESTELRLTLANDRRASLASVGTRIASAAVEACALLGLARVLTWSTGFSFWTVCAFVSMAYYAVSAACWDRTPLSHRLQRNRKTQAPAPEALPASSEGVLELLVRRAGLETYTPGATADPVDVVTGS